MNCAYFIIFYYNQQMKINIATIYITKQEYSLL